jgi:hypothetical protein
MVAGMVAAGARSSHARPAPAVRVAIVPIVAVNLDPTHVDALAQDLADALEAELIVDAVGGVEVRRALRPDLPADCATQPSCATEVATATNASQILFVVMVDTGTNGAAQIDATWVEPSSGRNVARPGVSLTSTVDADAKAKFREVARSLLPDAPARPKPKPQGAVAIHGDLVGGRPRHVTTPSLVTAGVAIAGLGATIGFGLATRSKYDRCEADAAGCSQPMKDSIRSYAIVTDISWAVAAAAAIATGVMYATSAESPHIVAAPTDTGGVVSWSGSF